MKSVLLSVLVLMLSVGFSHAAQNDQPSRSGSGARMKSMQAPGMGKYSRMLDSMVSMAEGMEISDEQKEKVAKIRNDYVSPMVKEELEFRKIHMQIMKMVEDPSFDAAEVKKEIEKADAINKKVADNYVDGLASLRDTLGAEKYTELNKSTYKYRQDLIQMRKKQMQRTMPSEPDMDTKTPAPEAADDAQDKDKQE